MDSCEDFTNSTGCPEVCSFSGDGRTAELSAATIRKVRFNRTLNSAGGGRAIHDRDNLVSTRECCLVEPAVACGHHFAAADHLTHAVDERFSGDLPILDGAESGHVAV